MSSLELIARCWTRAGDVVPMTPDERSPYEVDKLVNAVAATGWAGLGLAHHDLRLAGGIPA